MSHISYGSQQYRSNLIGGFQTKLEILVNRYREKTKKYRKRINIIDVAMYSVSGVVMGAGVILSSVVMIAPIAVPICISAIATISGVVSIITKKVSSCSQRKLQDYMVKLDIVSTSYKELSLVISVSLDDAMISDDEFSRMIKLYDLTMSKLEIDNINNNGDNVAGTTSTNSC